jgi:hypothetical protein
MSVETNLEDVVATLLRYADPERNVYPRLIRIQQSLQRGAIQGPSVRAYLERLQARLPRKDARKLQDNIECQGLVDSGPNAGVCTLIRGKGKCDCVDRFRRCGAYEPVRPLKPGARIM